MPRQPTGSIESYPWKDGRTVTWRVRVRASGRRHRIDLGTNHEGWNEDRARVELDRILREIERGTWIPPRQETAPAGPDLEETVHLTVSRWWQRRMVELSTNTQADYRWRIDYILGWRPRDRTSEIDARWVDDFRSDLVAKGLAPRSVNMVLDLLAQVLDDAVEYKLLDANPARGKRRRMKVEKPSRSFLEPDMVVDLLDVAGEWEADLIRRKRPDQCYGRRAFLATLCLAGPRISEAIESDRGWLDLHSGTLRLGKKTAAGRGRTLELSAFLLDELRAHLAAVPAVLRDSGGATLPLYPTRTGGRLNASNVRNRLLSGTPPKTLPNGKVKHGTKGVVQRVNEKRAAEGRMLLPDHVTPHTLRRTFASLCFFAGRDLRWVMGQLGHDDPRMTLAVYAQSMKRSRIDHDLVGRLMAFPGEQTMHSPGGDRGSFDPAIDPTDGSGG